MFYLADNFDMHDRNALLAMQIAYAHSVEVDRVKRFDTAKPLSPWEQWAMAMELEALLKQERRAAKRRSQNCRTRN